MFAGINSQLGKHDFSLLHNLTSLVLHLCGAAQVKPDGKLGVSNLRRSLIS